MTAQKYHQIHKQSSLWGKKQKEQPITDCMTSITSWSQSGITQKKKQIKQLKITEELQKNLPAKYHKPLPRTALKANGCLQFFSICSTSF